MLTGLLAGLVGGLAANALLSAGHPSRTHPDRGGDPEPASAPRPDVRSPPEPFDAWAAVAPKHIYWPLRCLVWAFGWFTVGMVGLVALQLAGGLSNLKAADQWLLPGLLIFGLLVALITWFLLRTLIGAAEARPATAAAAPGWEADQGRAQSLARIRVIVGGYVGIVALAGLGAVALIVLALTSSSKKVPAGLLEALSPYGPGLLSLLTLGAVAYVLSARQELAVLRATRDHHDRHPQ